uniref:Ovule protein n=1 Tax=Haemonchus placei TaxID=6290 RepID=A0A0N4WLA7_HAEPC
LMHHNIVSYHNSIASEITSFLIGHRQEISLIVHVVLTEMIEGIWVVHSQFLIQRAEGGVDMVKSWIY